VSDSKSIKFFSTMKVKSFATLLALAALLATTTSCGIIPGTSVKKIGAGSAGLLVQLYGDAKGIENSKVLSSGKTWYNGYKEEVIEFPLYVNSYPFSQSADEGASKDESITFSVGGSPVNADFAVAYLFTTDAYAVADKPPGYTFLHAFYEKYRKTPQEFTAVNLRQGLRTCLGETSESMGLTPSMLATKSGMLTKGVKVCLQAKFAEIEISEVSLLSAWRLEPTIQASIDEQFAAQQAAKTAESNKVKADAESLSELATAEGEAKVALTKAKAEAESNRLLAESVTPQLIELLRLEVESARIQKWDGAEASTIQTPVLQVGRKPAPDQ
jgi:regulator of protease activity HflC (stomatin/prohibitin superfamily)